MEHICPNCKTEWEDLLDSEGIDYRYVWCDKCRFKVMKYLTGMNTFGRI